MSMSWFSMWGVFGDPICGAVEMFGDPQSGDIYAFPDLFENYKSVDFF